MFINYFAQNRFVFFGCYDTVKQSVCVESLLSHITKSTKQANTNTNIHFNYFLDCASCGILQIFPEVFNVVNIFGNIGELHTDISWPYFSSLTRPKYHWILASYTR